MVAGSCIGTGASNVADEASLGAEVAVTSSIPEVPGQAADGLLYVAAAGAASVDGDGAAEGASLTVTLLETDAEVLWFQDRPGRQAGELRMSDFVSQWDEIGFRSDPPNAVIRHDGDDLGSVLEMRDPVWDQPNGVLQFTAVRAAGTSPLPALLSDVTLFIDDGGSSYVAAKLQVSNAAPGQSVRLDISAAGGSAPSWSAGGPDSNGAGVQLIATSGELPLLEFSLTESSIGIQTTQASGGSTMTFGLSLFLVVPDGTTTMNLGSNSDPGVEVTLALGTGVPQAVNGSPTEFSLQG